MARKVAGQRGSGVPNPVDVHVGARMRQRRTLLGMSQEKLAETLGITFQQVQKYERGVNRISASRLYDLSSILGCDANYFFADMPSEVSQRSPKALRGLSEAQATFELEKDPMARRETLELVRAYYQIEHQTVRRRIAELVKSIAGEERG